MSNRTKPLYGVYNMMKATVLCVLLLKDNEMPASVRIDSISQIVSTLNLSSLVSIYCSVSFNISMN